MPFQKRLPAITQMRYKITVRVINETVNSYFDKIPLHERKRNPSERYHDIKPHPVPEGIKIESNKSEDKELVYNGEIFKITDAYQYFVIDSTNNSIIDKITISKSLLHQNCTLRTYATRMQAELVITLKELAPSEYIKIDNFSFIDKLYITKIESTTD